MSTEATPPDAEDLLQLPATALVACPLAQPRMTRMDKCPACPNFAGLVDRFDDSSRHPFAVRYMVRCKAPRLLSLVEFEA